MTTFKGALRSYSAAVRKAEKLNQQRNREAARRFRLQKKAEDMQNASQAVSDWVAYIKHLKTLHLDYSQSVDWNEIISLKPPEEPTRTTTKESLARFNIDNYKPSIIDNLFGGSGRKLKKLNQALQQAIAADGVDFKLKTKEYLDDLETLSKLQSIADGVLKKDVNAYKAALDYFQPFDDLTELAKQLNIKLNEDYLEIEMEALSYDIIPGYELSLTSTGRLSRRDMSISKYNELFQEHICSSVIRIAKEIAIYFPINIISITVIINELNPATGHRVDNIVLSMLTTPTKIGTLNLEAINPTDCVKSFVHNMKFTKSAGFADVPKIDISDNLLSI